MIFIEIGLITDEKEFYLKVISFESYPFHRFLLINGRIEVEVFYF